MCVSIRVCEYTCVWVLALAPIAPVEKTPDVEERSSYKSHHEWNSYIWLRFIQKTTFSVNYDLYRPIPREGLMV